MSPLLSHVFISDGSFTSGPIFQSNLINNVTVFCCAYMYKVISIVLSENQTDEEVKSILNYLQFLLGCSVAYEFKTTDLN
jgi:hypothetical protein